MALSPLNQRRWRNFRRNRRAFWSLILFAILFAIALPAEFIANDKPILIQYRGGYYMPVLKFYPETEFGGYSKTEAIYTDPEVKCLIRSGGHQDCLDEVEEYPQEMTADEILAGITAGTWGADVEGFQKGWAIWPIIPYSYDTTVDRAGAAPLPPNSQDLLGTDDRKRDVVARVLYGFRLSVLFTLIVTALASAIGIFAGAIQGYFGGRTDLIFQRIIEIWAATPQLYVIIILFAILPRSFWLLVFITVLFGWMALVGVVRAEFLRARNLEYVRAAKALGVSNLKIMFRHMLPNAMVATLTMLPFVITGTISLLASLDFLGFGLPSSSPSLGELTLQAKQNLQAPWLAFTAFFAFAIMLSLLIFIFEGIRDAFDPRKTFQ